MTNILIVEDNKVIAKGLKYSLEQEGFNVVISPNGILTRQYIDNNDYDLVLLDISLPDDDGYSLCEYIKKNKDIKIIFLTAKDEEENVVHGFEIGADDYIIKPFRTRELISRINNVLRRKKNNIIKNDNITIDLDSYKVYEDNNEIVFTTLEFKILSLLFLNLDRVVTREQIFNYLYEYDDNYVNDNTLTVYIKRIREKLSNKEMIKTIKGLGYRVDKK